MAELNKEIEERIAKTKADRGRLPRFDTVAKSLNISMDEAKALLNQYKAKHGGRIREAPEFGRMATVKESLTSEPAEKVSLFDRLVIKFAHQLQNVGFSISTIVDVVLACFFLYSLGSGTLAQIAMSSLGLVLTAGKLWGWAYSKINKKAFPLAIFTVVLSLFGNTAILRAEFELQAKTVLSSNTSNSATQTPEEVIQGQITAKQSELTKKTAARDAIDSTIETNLPMYNTLDAKVKLANKELTELNAQLTSVQKSVAKVEKVSENTAIQLDAWSVFRQWTEIDFEHKPRLLAYFFALIFACLPELVIFATTPRKELTVKKEGGE